MTDAGKSMPDDIAKIIEEATQSEHHNMQRDRPYSGQSHTVLGERGATEIKGITFRDLRDAYIRAICLAAGGAHDDNMVFYNQACKGERAVLASSDVYKLKGDVDPMAIIQQLHCEIERLMGIYPNIPNHDG